uniref:Uncharacterized protein n=1 Tax=Cannabis sativa TaxID=3483 RepID=A0A803PSB5_CANSA
MRKAKKERVKKKIVRSWTQGPLSRSDARSWLLLDGLEEFTPNTLSMGQLGRITDHLIQKLCYKRHSLTPHIGCQAFVEGLYINFCPGENGGIKAFLTAESTMACLHKNPFSSSRALLISPSICIVAESRSTAPMRGFQEGYLHRKTGTCGALESMASRIPRSRSGVPCGDYRSDDHAFSSTMPGKLGQGISEPTTGEPHVDLGEDIELARLKEAVGQAILKAHQVEFNYRNREVNDLIRRFNERIIGRGQNLIRNPLKLSLINSSDRDYGQVNNGKTIQLGPSSKRIDLPLPKDGQILRNIPYDKSSQPLAPRGVGGRQDILIVDASQIASIVMLLHEIFENKLF